MHANEALRVVRTSPGFSPARCLCGSCRRAHGNADIIPHSGSHNDPGDSANGDGDSDAFTSPITNPYSVASPYFGVDRSRSHLAPAPDKTRTLPVALSLGHHATSNNTRRSAEHSAPMGPGYSVTLGEGKEYLAVDFGLKSGLGVVIVLGVQDGVVDSIATNVGLVNDNNEATQREWAAFPPDVILSQYGEPDRVDFVGALPACGRLPCKIHYIMTMYFDSPSLVVEYDRKLINDEEIVRVCPLTDAYDGLRVWLGRDAHNVPSQQGVPLEDATSLTTQKFYTLLLQEPQAACFDLSGDAVERGH